MTLGILDMKYSYNIYVVASRKMRKKTFFLRKITTFGGQYYIQYYYSLNLFGTIGNLKYISERFYPCTEIKELFVPRFEWIYLIMGLFNKLHCFFLPVG